MLVTDGRRRFPEEPPVGALTALRLTKQPLRRFDLAARLVGYETTEGSIKTSGTIGEGETSPGSVGDCSRVLNAADLAANDAFARSDCLLERRIIDIDGVTERSRSAVAFPGEVRVWHVIAVLTHAHSESKEFILSSGEIFCAHSECHIVQEALTNIESRMNGSHVQRLGSDGVWGRCYEVPFAIDGWVIDVEALISQACRECQHRLFTRYRLGVGSLCARVPSLGVKRRNI